MTADKKRKKLFFTLKIVFICFFVVSACVFSYPFIREFFDTRHANDLSSEFDKAIMKLDNAAKPVSPVSPDNGFLTDSSDGISHSGISENTSGPEIPADTSASEEGNDNLDSKTPDNNSMILPELWEKLQKYNLRLSTTGQDKMSDILSYEGFEVDNSSYGLPDNIIGYLSIPAINRVYPLYLGSSRPNLLKGATVLGESSAPVGGESTHCVIAAHSSWSGAERFKKISTLRYGDLVTITNPWETLTYRVIDHKKILPNDFSALTIQEGKDLLTLFTCCSYGKARWCVLCERVK